MLTTRSGGVSLRADRLFASESSRVCQSLVGGGKTWPEVYNWVVGIKSTCQQMDPVIHDQRGVVLASNGTDKYTSKYLLSRMGRLYYKTPFSCVWVYEIPS